MQSLAEFHKTKDQGRNKKKGDQVNLAAARVFARYDVVETSYHFYSDRIDLHLCDDPGGSTIQCWKKEGPENVKRLFFPTEGRSCHPELSEGGAFQVSLSQLQVDLYPYHLAAGNRAAWIRYQEGVHATWLANSLAAFQNSLLDALVPGGGGGGKHSPLARAGGGAAAAAAAQVSFPEEQSFSGFIVLSHPSFLSL